VTLLRTKIKNKILSATFKKSEEGSLFHPPSISSWLAGEGREALVAYDARGQVWPF
jgi:hypothetical protein